MRATWLILAVFVIGTLLLTPERAVRAEESEKIAKAVDWGVRFLKANQRQRGFWTHQSDGFEDELNIGTTALVGLALIESEVPLTDPMLVQAANIVRGAAPKLEQTYAIAAACIFLDRYRGGKDPALVRMLAIRLAAGQNQTDGCWGYQCRVLSPQEEQRWAADLTKLRNFRKFEGVSNTSGNNTDNSNAQFAVLALWVARVHGIPVEYPLLKAEWHFRTTQHEGGPWDYGNHAGGQQHATPSMTCAGLIGLAIAYGAKQEARVAALRAGGDKIEGGGGAPVKVGPPQLTIENDPAVIKAKAYLSTQFALNPDGIPHMLYYLWSLERVSVTYKWKDYNNVDWYDYGAKILLNRQQKDGSWRIENSSNVDTALALLFLRKANLVGDISGQATLRAGSSDPTKAASSDPLGGKGGTGGAVKAPEDLKSVDPAKAEAEAAKLVKEFPSARIARQREIAETLQNTVDKTGNYTAALIELIGKSRDNVQTQLRNALADRMSRQTVESLVKKLADEDPEMRIAAISALGKKGEKKAGFELIKFLSSSKEEEAAAAQAALEALTQKNFGRNGTRWQEYFDAVVKQ